MASRTELPARQRRALARLHRALADYRKKFGLAESDVYHVLRALSWFDDAERDRALPRGLTQAHWRQVRSSFEGAARRELLRRARDAGGAQ